jgi:ubiquinol-cytochrome c reductase iron-sulfur subunit
MPRRDFLQVAAWAGSAVGLAGMAWPLVDYMNPSKDVLALASVEVPLEPITTGMAITVVWRGKPVFVRHRSDAEIKAAADATLSQLPDPQPDSQRVKPGHEQWLILIGICTHLGCIPTGNREADPRGAWGGWFCPCHGSSFDTSGRIRQGPAPTNLIVPPYTFLTDTRIRIG